MKHYPIIVAGEKAAACVETGWNWATISLKFSHRKGQKVNFAYYELSPIIKSIWVDEYPTYTALRFNTRQGYFRSPQDAIAYCANLVESVNRSINFKEKDDLITKELLIVLG